MDVFSIVYYFTIFSIPILLHIVFSKKKKSPYNAKAWYGFIKQLLARPHVKYYQNICRDEFSKCTFEELESPRKFIKPEKDNDTTLIYGIDEKGNSIIIRMILRQTNYAELTLQIRLNNGKIYQLPNEPKVLLCSTDPLKWKAGGLTINVLQPFVTLRLTFNGLLRNVARNNINEEIGEIEHVKFNFIWKAGSNPIHYPQDYSWQFIAETLARERWRDGDWLKLLGDNKYYDQYGSLHGFIKGTSFQSEEYFYFKSWRKHFWGKADCFAAKRDLSIFVTVDNGNIFNVGVKSLKNGCTHAKYGSALLTDGDFGAIDDTDLNLEYIGENKLIPDSFTFHVNVKNKVLKTVLHFDKTSITKSYNNETVGWKLITAQAECVVNGKKGQAVITCWYPHSGFTSNLPKPILSEEVTNFIQAPKVIRFNAPGSKMLCYAGGKGCSLGLLASIETQEFAVPEGFVVTTESFKYQLKQNTHLKDAILHLEDIAYGKITGNLQEACEKTMQLIASEEVDKSVADLILDEVKQIQSNSSNNNLEVWKWAVRSSGVCEDSEDLSAAGQNSTFLGITSDEKLLKAIASCWASLYSFQSVQYRRQYGLKVDNEIAVVVQRMVPSDAAGVLFTCHPATEDPSKMVITGNFGLGESVVSGNVDPDTITLQKTWTGKISIDSRQMGRKEKVISLKEQSENIDGTETVEIEDNQKNTFCISDEQAIKLGKIGVMLEELFGGPRDIEWAFYKGVLYLLQSRPITTLNSWTEYELLHEFDTAIFSDTTISIRANIGEVLPKAVSPLTLTTITNLLEVAFTESNIFINYSPFYLQFITTFGHVVHLNATSVMYRALDSKINLANKLSDMTIFGHVTIDEKIHQKVMEKYGPVSRYLKFRLMSWCIMECWRAKKNTKFASDLRKKIEKNINNAITSYTSSMDLFRKIKKSLPIQTELNKTHNVTSMSSSFYEVIAMNILAEGNEDLTPEHYADIAELLSSCEDVVSASVPNDLEMISKAILKSELRDEFLNIPPKDGIDWLNRNCSEVKNMFDKFIETHGHRGIAEFELSEPSWGVKPEIVIEMLQQICKNPQPIKKSKGSSLDETLSQLKTPKAKFTKPMLKFFMSKGRRAVGYREHTKSEIIFGGAMLRKSFTKLGEQMELDGIIPKKELVFYFTLYEIEQILLKPDPGLVLKATLRFKYFPKWRNTRFPELSFGVPQPIKTENKSYEINESNFKMNGTPASSGEVSARACVIKSLDEINQLQAGDILITYATDIGWSPYFPILSGIVTELGGLISHGAVVAREYGLPCLIGVTDACNYFKTGDQIFLSTKTGTLQLISRDS